MSLLIRTIIFFIVYVMVFISAIMDIATATGRKLIDVQCCFGIFCRFYTYLNFLKDGPRIGNKPRIEVIVIAYVPKERDLDC